MNKTHITPYIRRAKYYETDQMGIIHHSNYIRWMEEARMDAMSKAGIPYKDMEETGILCPVLSVSCKYRNMVHFDDVVEIYVKVLKYNGIRFDLAYEFKDTQTGVLCTTGTSSHCFLDRDHRILSLKFSYPELHEKFKAMSEEDSHGLYRGNKQT